MGRNTNPQMAPVVPVNGAIYRNSAGNGLIIDATGAQYLPSNSTCLLTSSNYAKYVSLNSQTSTALNIGISLNSVTNFGTVVPSLTSLSVSIYLPYIGGTQPTAFYPFTSRTGKFRYLGMGGTNGTVSLGTQNPPGYKQASSNAQGNAMYNATTGAFVSTPTMYPIASWYDTSTSLFRVIASPNSSGPSTTAVLYTSSNGAVWTSTAISLTNVSSFNYTQFGDATYYNMGATAINQKGFFSLKDSNGSNQVTMFRTTNGGATVAEVTTAITGSAAYYTPAGSPMCRFNHNYDGTTLFVPANSGWVYSTNDGTSFTATTISGVTTTNDQSPAGVFSAANNSSSLMIVYNSRITSNRVFFSANGGQTFTTYSWTPAATLNSSAFQCPGDYDSTNSRWCFVYGTVNGWYAAVSTNNGSTWTHNLVQGTSLDDAFMNIVFLGGVWYVYGTIGVWKSTDAATWTNVTVNNAITNYAQPYMELTDYVMFGSSVIKKSDFSVTTFNPSAIISNQSGYEKGFQLYLGADAIMQVQSQYTRFPLLVTSATAGTANNYSPYPYTTQQTGSGGTYPNTIEYWRIK